jgi:KTSC domain
MAERLRLWINAMRANCLRACLALFLFFQTPGFSAEPAPPPLSRVRVTSSFIASVGYDAKARVLDVKFHSGSLWRYFDVPPEIYRAFLDAESKGRFYNANIRHHFKSQKLEPVENGAEKTAL